MPDSNAVGSEDFVRNNLAAQQLPGTRPVSFEINIADIGIDDCLFEAGGLHRMIRVFRIPDENTHTTFEHSVKIKLTSKKDTPLYVRLRQDDGHEIWSSPIYIYKTN